MGGGQRRCETGVLHADFDGDRAVRALRSAGEPGGEEAEQVSEDVVAHDDEEDEEARLKDLGL